jgi:hypothetical protein
LHECPTVDGYPDFSIEPPLIESELESPPIFAEETGAIWIDLEQNGFVEDWNDPDQIRQSILHTRQQGTKVVPILSGDILAINKQNRIYVVYDHSGGVPTEDVSFKLFAKPKFEGLLWENSKWIEVDTKILNQNDAIDRRTFIFPDQLVVRFDWRPTKIQLEQAIISDLQPMNPILESLKIKVIINSPEEFLINNNMTIENITEIYGY